MLSAHIPKLLFRKTHVEHFLSGVTANVCLIVGKRPSPDQADCDLTAHEKLERKSKISTLL